MVRCLEPRCLFSRGSGKTAGGANAPRLLTPRRIVDEARLIHRGILNPQWLADEIAKAERQNMQHTIQTEHRPRVVDNDADEITVEYRGEVVRSYHYEDGKQRRPMMIAAREFVEGWHTAILKEAK